MREVYDEAARLIAAGRRGVVISIVEGSGSMPRSKGTAMLVRDDGSIVSTIGGGRLEGEAMAFAPKVMGEAKPTVYTFDLSSADVAESDMICGGHGKLLFYPCIAGDLEVYKAVSEQGQGHVVSLLGEDGSGRLVFVDGERNCIAGGELTDELRKLALDAAGPSMHSDSSDGYEVYSLSLHSPGKVILLGAGHVARETAKVALVAGFEVLAVDDRAEFLNAGRFPGCELLLLESMERLPDLDLGPDSYLIIVTRGHMFDGLCLHYALEHGKNAAYLGMIGSRRKRELLYKRERELGCDEELLGSVHSPIGLSIGAQTPGEIAVCIVGELISVRAKRSEA